MMGTDCPTGIRLSLFVSEETNARLEELAREMDTTKSGVLRRAVALMVVAVQAKKEGKKFGLAGPGQVLETEIVGI